MQTAPTKSLLLNDRHREPLTKHPVNIYRNEDLRLKKFFKYSDPLWVYSYPQLLNLKIIDAPIKNLKDASQERSAPSAVSHNTENAAQCFKNISDFKKYYKLFQLNNKIIYKYLDTYTPYKGLIFLTASILPVNILSIKNIISNNSLKTPNYIPKKIWVYNSNDLTLVNNTPFTSIKSASSFLKINASSIKSIINSNIALSKGFYFFDHEISDQLKSNLILNPNVKDPISNLRIEV